MVLCIVCTSSMKIRSMYMITWSDDLRRVIVSCFFFQAEDGIRDLVRSRGLGDVYKRQKQDN